MIWSLLTAVIAVAVRGATTATAGPSGCVSFDVNWNLLAFGVNGKDYNAGTQDTWTSSSSLTDITTQGRPPFNAGNATCYLSQFTNAIYVLNADSANPSSIYIYDAAAKSWSRQTVDAGKFDPTNFATILDHDTNVFYSYSDGELFSLDMGLLKAANSTPIPWVDVQQPDLSVDQTGAAVPGANTAGYQPVMALAQNHVHFLGVPGMPAGSAKIFVIHFSYMQPAPQSYGNFPTSHGKTASFFLDAGVQQEFAYIPDDGSATYVINVEVSQIFTKYSNTLVYPCGQKNTTKTLTGPPQQDPFASYSASTSALVQLTTSGKVAFLPYQPSSTTSGGTWTTISKIPIASASGNSSNGTAISSGNTPADSTGNNSTNTTKNSSAGTSSTRMGSQSLICALTAVALAVAGVVAL
ncbi:hypothetical protein M413DRAFT_291010 [Hebeloma cylindrosporum]|uniref:Uncharacterized protein n=1 Tax=Hebeloma cylindrosporum TaxID=76867 RepID=A0A0C3BHV6_HEBCY|nr:hypothetical protein M413DRAFT_291010 [Hebeloma cylindrosporum h7]